jgi:hypothetical protein
MKKWSVGAIFAAALIVLVIWAWRTLFPNHEQIIRHRLLEVASAASFSPNETPLVTLRNCEKLAAYCVPDVEIVVDVPGHSRETVNGREELVQKALQARALGTLTVEFLDFTVNVASDKKSAVVTLTGKGRIGGESDFMVEELRFTMKRVEDAWLIARIETLKPM